MQIDTTEAASGSRGSAGHRWGRWSAGPGVWFALYFLALLAGLLALRTPGTMPRGNELGWDRAVFAAVNAGTLTGFQQTIGVGQYLEAGQYAILFLMISGAMFSLVMGGVAVDRIVGLGHSVGAIVMASVVGVGGAALVGAVALVGTGQGAFDRVFLAISAFAHGGLHTGALPAADGWATQLVLLPLAVVGGLGVPVVLDLFDRVVGRRGRLSGYTVVVLGLLGGVYVVQLLATVALMGGEGWAGASVLSLNSRSVGFDFEFLSVWPRTVQWLTLPAMVLGSGPGSVAGGMSVGTLAVMFVGLRRIGRGEPVGRALGGVVILGVAYLGIVLGTVMVLAGTSPRLGGEQLVLDAVSAGTNAGLSYDSISVVGPGLHGLAGAMLLGRLLPVAVLWWVAGRKEEGER